MTAKSKAVHLAHRSLPNRATTRNAFVNAPPSCTSSAAGLTGSRWTTGSKRRPRYWEHRSNGRSKRQRGRRSWRLRRVACCGYRETLLAFVAAVMGVPLFEPRPFCRFGAASQRA